MAQLVAHHTGSVGVRGSSPLSSTRNSLDPLFLVTTAVDSNGHPSSSKSSFIPSAGPCRNCCSRVAALVEAAPVQAGPGFGYTCDVTNAPDEELNASALDCDPQGGAARGRQGTGMGGTPGWPESGSGRMPASVGLAPPAQPSIGKRRRSSDQKENLTGLAG